LKLLLLDLYVAWSADPDLKIMFSRNNNSYKAKSRYNELHVGKKIIGIVDVLIEQGIICQKDGFNDRISGIGFQSRLWASDGLIKKFSKAKFNQFHIHSDEKREAVVLRDDEKNPVDDYTDTPETNRMRSVLGKYNQLLSNTHIDIYDLELPVLEIGSGKRKMRLQINQRDKFVRRIFNNSRWDQGGRFYGGWWQRCPKGYRLKIKMDGVLTTEIDFSGLHIVILYAQEGINYWADVNDDPYELHGIQGIDPEIDLRAAAKLLLLTAINAETETKAFGAFREQAETGTLEKRLRNEQLSQILFHLKTKHAPIAHKLASGAGIDLMYADSQITELLIQRFTDRGIPILTVHDSYIIPIGYDDILEQEMQNAFEAVTGIPQPSVKQVTDHYTVIDQEPDPALSKEELAEYLGNPTSQRHIQELKLFRQFRGKPEREDWVPHWTGLY
jgi:hypothetical protein